MVNVSKENLSNFNQRLRKKLLVLLVGCIRLFGVAGQNHDATWVLGEDNGGETDFIEGNLIDFRIDPILIREESLYLEMHTTMASICDAEGNLQFYTNGCKIANWQHQLIENGDGINPGEIHEQYCINEDYPWRGHYVAGNQSAMILPMPGNDSLYYLFHKGRDPNISGNNYNGPLYYTVVNMHANDGLGRVVSKNNVILDAHMHFGQLTAVKHANGTDWWIVTPGAVDDNAYFRVLLSSQGLGDIAVQHIGNDGTRTGGWANFSPDGTMFARYAPRDDDVYLFDFNRETGELSNFQQIVIEEEEEWVGGVAFSPSSQFLYVSSYDYLYQFDTWAEDIAGSRVIVGQYQYQGQFIEENFWGMQLGPDCRIYVYCNSCDVIHVIQEPDEPGLACQFQQGAIALPWPIFRSQPHFPNYRLGPVGDEGLPCSPVVSVREPMTLAPELTVYPNPAKDWLTLSTEGDGGMWQLYNQLGQLQLQERLQAGETRSISISNLPAGLYFWQLGTNAASGKLLIVD